ncbi:HNH endonuclease [Herbiconiux daphne]|uniref:HNH endonuclease n=1 Tax=Herbiconiux daphne TaxID=2970914 RepID=A0ABT2H1B1_9MICO|nr:HNH endonuclease signature motif containing protein [Herbiconiux daphne]MCS5733705.1 HNH endonuclease [Herbiconiux daphne]
MKPTFTLSRDSAVRSRPVVALPTLHERFDAAIRRVAEHERAISGLEAARTRDLAEAAGLAEAIERGELGRALRGNEHEWARRKLLSEIGCLTHRSERTLARLLNESEVLVANLPATVDALASGDISYQHARSMVAHASTLPELARSAFELATLPAARELTAARFDDRARRLRERLHPESIVVRTATAHAERSVWLEPQCDGMATLHHHLAAADAFAIHDLIDRTARSLRADDEPRTHAQLCSDVLADAVLGRDEKGRRLSPTVVVTVPAATLAGAADDPGDLHGYGPIDPATARRIAAHAPSFLRALIDPDTGETLSVGRRRYLAPADLRTALMLDDETCRFPGCGRRAARCELDHTLAWAEGGETSATNLAHLCSRHHHLKHEGGWSVSPAAGTRRGLDWRSPRGNIYRTLPEGRRRSTVASASPPASAPAPAPAAQGDPDTAPISAPLPDTVPAPPPPSGGPHSTAPHSPTDPPRSAPTRPATDWPRSLATHPVPPSSRDDHGELARSVPHPEADDPPPF